MRLKSQLHLAYLLVIRTGYRTMTMVNHQFEPILKKNRNKNKKKKNKMNKNTQEEPEENEEQKE